MNIEEVYRDIWKIRRAFAEEWPIPTPHDCALFALTEWAEAVDVMLRSNDTYLRNHDKVGNLRGELGQAVMMVCLIRPDCTFDDLVGVSLSRDLLDPFASVTYMLARLIGLAGTNADRLIAAYIWNTVAHLTAVAVQAGIDDLDRAAREACTRWPKEKRR